VIISAQLSKEFTAHKRRNSLKRLNLTRTWHSKILYPIYSPQHNKKSDTYHYYTHPRRIVIFFNKHISAEMREKLFMRGGGIRMSAQGVTRKSPFSIVRCACDFAVAMFIYRYTMLLNKSQAAAHSLALNEKRKMHSRIMVNRK
jgi:hypothetical protein